jgi:hypothetical protein
LPVTLPRYATLESARSIHARRWASFVGPLRAKSWRADDSAGPAGRARYRARSRKPGHIAACAGRGVRSRIDSAKRPSANAKPTLVFLLDPATPWSPTWIDAFTGDGDRGTRINALREELGRERLVSFFTTADELAQQVGAAVTNLLAQLAAAPRYQLREGLPTVPAGRAWTIPPPVRAFSGRGEQLSALRTQLTGQGAATLVPTAALIGMGGVGRTQLALAYAQRYRGDYELGWWVPAETELGMVSALADLGAELGLSAELPPAELAAGARDVLGGRSGWLLVFDNAPEPAAVAEYLPGAGGGHVLVTSRDSAWQGIADPVPVDLLPQQEAVGLLLRRSGDLDQQAAARLGEALGRLPLALEQAAAYAATERISLARYLKLFEQRRGELLALGRPLAYQGTVDATFTLAWDQLREANPAAGQLLELCALLAPDEIPLPLLLSNPRLLPEPLAAAVTDPLRHGDVAGVLYRQGRLTVDSAATARMHRLVQAVILAHLTEADRDQRLVDAVELLAELFPYPGEDPDGWPRSAQLLAHTQVVLDHAAPSSSPVQHCPSCSTAPVAICGAAGSTCDWRGSCTSRPWPCASGCMRATTQTWPPA